LKLWESRLGRNKADLTKTLTRPTHQSKTAGCACLIATSLFFFKKQKPHFFQENIDLLNKKS
jgi:hypothetical protein